jgi:hypothetical protein
MARGIKMEYDTDLLNRAVYVVEFLEDEWDNESSIGAVPYRYLNEAQAAGRAWLYGKANNLNDLAPEAADYHGA